MAPKAAAAKKSTYKPKKATGTKKASVAAGTVAIMLAGRFRGKHCVVLKQLPKSGPLVVSGPFKYNGIPIRRVNSRYIIPTSTKIDIAGIDAKVLEKVDTKLFQRKLREKKAKSAAGFLGTKSARKAAASKAGKKKIPDERVALQKSVDAGLIAAIKKDSKAKQLPGYLRSVFTVKPGDCPHRMKF